MTTEQRRGRVYMLVAIGTLLLFDLVVKLLLLAAGTLRWSQLIGTTVTLVLCWFLWRGSKGAYGFLLFCLGAGLLYGVLVASKLPILATTILFIVLGTVSASLLAPATRSFAAFRREALGMKA